MALVHAILGERLGNGRWTWVDHYLRPTKGTSFMFKVLFLVLCVMFLIILGIIKKKIFSVIASDPLQPPFIF